jgi:hypothetical protein
MQLYKPFNNNLSLCLKTNTIADPLLSPFLRFQTVNSRQNMISSQLHECFTQLKCVLVKVKGNMY